MIWDDLEKKELDLIEALTEALASFDWHTADAKGQELVIEIYRRQNPFPLKAAKSILGNLRRKGRFHVMSLLSEAMIRSGQNDPLVRRQYAQSLIDQGSLSPAEMVLQTIIQDPTTSRIEDVEAHGLIGRIYKQLYVNTARDTDIQRRDFFERSLNEYLYGYRLDRNNFWHGINIVALLKRAQRDHISLQGLPDAAQTAEEILDILRISEEKSANGVEPFEIGTNLEALIALGRNEEAGRKAFEYSLCMDADAFEINSTLRQLTEVWQLDENDMPGSKVLPILRAALLRRAGGEIRLEAQDTSREIENIRQVKSDYEGIYGHDKTETMDWYETGSVRSKAVARIDDFGGKGFGTGWLANRSDFFPGENGLLLVTNEHVVSANPRDPARRPNEARANFQGLGSTYDVGEIVWSSPREELDTTLLTIKGEPQTGPLPLHAAPVEMCKPPPRLYIIGHPGGRNTEISIHDNHLVACNDRYLHYRTPTECGSSGSPVFDPKGWRVVALHHRGKSDMPRLDGQAGNYEANEGVTIPAIKEAITKWIKSKKSGIP